MSFSIDSVILHNEGVGTQEGRERKREKHHTGIKLSIWVGTSRKEGGDQKSSDIMLSVFLWEIFSISLSLGNISEKTKNIGVITF